MEKIEIYEEELEHANLLGMIQAYEDVGYRFEDASSYVEKRTEKLAERINKLEEKIEQYELDK